MLRQILTAAFAVSLMALPALGQTLAERNETMFAQMQSVRGVSGGGMIRIRQIFANSPNGWMGQGNPAVTRHPLTPEEAAARIGGSVSQCFICCLTKVKCSVWTVTLIRQAFRIGQYWRDNLPTRRRVSLVVSESILGQFRY